MRPRCLSPLFSNTLVLPALVGLCCTWSTLQAQVAVNSADPRGSPPAEVSVGITLSAPRDVNLHPLCDQLSLPCGSPRTFPDFGLTLSAAANVTDWLALVGEISAYDNGWVDTDNMSTINHVASFLAGPRVRVRVASGGEHPLYDLHVFGQVLGGSVISQSFPGGNAVQPGVGVDVTTKRGHVIRVEFDHCFLPGKPRDLPGDRVLVGMVFGVGKRQ